MANITRLLFIKFVIIFGKRSGNKQKSVYDDDCQKLQATNFIQSENKLLCKIFKNYNKQSRPVSKYEDPVKVNLDLYLVRLLNLDELDQKMTTNLWVKHNWSDHRFIWEPKNYFNITEIILKPEQIWIPDIILYNSADSKFSMSDENFNNQVQVKINYKGQVHWTPIATFTSECQLNVKYFPFDVQMCMMKFGCWTNDVNKVHIYIPKNEINTKVYIPNDKWELKNNLAKSLKTYYEDANKTFVDIEYYFIYKRNSKYYIINIVIPILIFGLLISCVFYLPADSSERLSLALSILVSLSVFQVLVMELIPKATKDTTILTILLTMLTIMVFMTIIFSIMITRLYMTLVFNHRPNKLVWELFFEFIGPRMHLTDYSTLQRIHDVLVLTQTNLEGDSMSEGRKDDLSDFEHLHHDPDHVNHRGTTLRGGIIYPLKFSKAMKQATKPKPLCEEERKKPPKPKTKCFLTRNQYRKCIIQLRNKEDTIRKLKNQDIRDQPENELGNLEWSYIAMCCDRLCMIFFFVLISGSSVWFFFHLGMRDRMVGRLYREALGGVS